MSSILTGVGIVFEMFCKPSLGPTSKMRTLDRESISSLRFVLKNRVTGSLTMFVLELRNGFAVKLHTTKRKGVNGLEAWTVTCIASLDCPPRIQHAVPRLSVAGDSRELRARLANGILIDANQGAVEPREETTEGTEAASVRRVASA
jgi:hypothetical protein